LDRAAVEREVLLPVSDPEDATFLPSLRDPVSNRSTHAERRSLQRTGVLILTGELLLGLGLSLDASIHLAISRQARKRLISDDWAWTLPAYDRYDIDVDPTAVADVAIRYDDPRHPALSLPERRASA
jgi:hypothetical protein